MLSLRRSRISNSFLPSLSTLCIALLVCDAHGQERNPNRQRPDRPQPEQSDRTPEEIEEIEAETIELFAVPENASVDELLQFIARARRLLPERRPSPNRLMRIRIESVLTACDMVIATGPDIELEKQMIENKLGGLNAMRRYYPDEVAQRVANILKSLEEDPRPEIAAYLQARSLADKARGFSRLSDDEREALLASVFEEVEQVGVSSDLYSVLSREGRALERGQRRVAAALYTRLAEALEESEDPTDIQRARVMRGTVRRFRMHGSMMEVMGTTTDGDPIDWESYRGKVVLVDFWASWCGPCIDEFPNVKKQLELYGDKGFTVVGVNLDQAKSRCMKFVEKEEITWVNLFSTEPGQQGWNNPLATHYGIRAIPTAILVDQEGKVVSLRARGDNLDQLLAELLGPAEGPPQATDATTDTEPAASGTSEDEQTAPAENGGGR